MLISELSDGWDAGDLRIHFQKQSVLSSKSTAWFSSLQGRLVVAVMFAFRVVFIAGVSAPGIARRTFPLSRQVDVGCWEGCSEKHIWKVQAIILFYLSICAETGLHYAAQTALSILLPQPPKCQDYRSAPLCCCSTGLWTQGLAVARLALSLWATPPAFFALAVFQVGSCFCQGWLGPWSSWSLPTKFLGL
jgi:hypothetical protein